MCIKQTREDAVQPGAGQCSVQGGIKVVVMQNTSSGFQRAPYTCDQYGLAERYKLVHVTCDF